VSRDNVSLDKGFIGTTGNAPYELEPRVIPFGVSSANEYEARCLPAASVAVFIETGRNDVRIGMIALAMGPDGGLFIGMEPNDLRAFGSSLLSMADQLDEGKGKQ
jgi:hypothetical protein